MADFELSVCILYTLQVLFSSCVLLLYRMLTNYMYIPRNDLTPITGSTGRTMRSTPSYSLSFSIDYSYFLCVSNNVFILNCFSAYS